jgi:hypothetical protein
MVFPFWNAAFHIGTPGEKIHGCARTEQSGGKFVGGEAVLMERTEGRDWLRAKEWRARP